MRIAFVAPFYGAEASGGAEAECRATAMHLSAAGHGVEVFTTCALDIMHDWNVNYHRRGTRKEDGLPVHRFPVETIDLGLFFSLNDRIISGGKLSREEQNLYFEMHVCSTALLEALGRAYDSFDWFCFIPYLFSTTVFGSAICSGKNVLMPCLHDEPYARLEIVGDLFRKSRRIVFHTKSERQLAESLYGPMESSARLVGEGASMDFPSDANRFRSKFHIADPFLLYVGRKDSSKNVHTLVEYFAEYAGNSETGLKLVLIGPGSVRMPVTVSGRIIDLGFVSEEDKRDAYSAAAMLCQPSLNESFSIVMMEAWVCGIPCLVHGKCSVTRDHVVEAGGGLYFENYPEFEGCLRYIGSHPAEVASMGRAGRDYVKERYAWDRIVARFQDEVFV
ncbi:MAG: hexosyltransferase [Verrucomicrobia bacterium]|nr:hexosyltransferase [Verrucomicrobiota bacterium]